MTQRCECCDVSLTVGDEKFLLTDMSPADARRLRMAVRGADGAIVEAEIVGEHAESIDAASAGRWFVGTDDDCHSYLVPVERRAEWDAWASLPSSDPRAWEPPSFAQRIDGIHRLTFTDPQER